VDFDLDAGQRLLAEVARDYLAAKCPLEADSPPPPWSELAGLGWCEPGPDGADQAVLAEELGYGLCAGPWFTVGLALPAYRAAGMAPSGPKTLAWLDDRTRSLREAANGSGCELARQGGARLTGVKHAVPNAAEADAVVVTALGPDGVELVAADLDAPGVRIEPQDTVDGTRPLSTVRFDDVPVVGLVEGGETVLAEIRQRALTLLAAEAIGVGRRALDIAVGHASTRVQFGRPIGVHQAISHRLAEVYQRVQLGRSLVFRAAIAEDDNAAAMALVAAAEAAVFACEAAIQTLGGAGFGWDHPLHRLYRRAQAAARFEGSLTEHRVEIGAAVLAGTEWGTTDD